MTLHAGSRSLPKYLTSGTKNLGPLRSFDGSFCCDVDVDALTG